MNCSHCGHPVDRYKNPVPTVDIIIELKGGIVLIKRKNKPFGWALPGGFVDYGESLEDAATREAYEETGLKIKLMGQFHTYSEPDRDPRLHTISTVFLAVADAEPKAGDDALLAKVFFQDDLPELVFDHGTILGEYYTMKKTGND